MAFSLQHCFTASESSSSGVILMWFSVAGEYCVATRRGNWYVSRSGMTINRFLQSPSMLLRRVWHWLPCLMLFVPPFSDAAETVPHTRIDLDHGHWLINGHPTNPGSAAEGLLMNVRMVNAVFEDPSKHPEFDPDANTARFIARLSDYAAHGVNAFTICLQGGMPGYEGATNSAFEPDGSLRTTYLARVERVIRACDQQGIVVILGLYYQRQSAILRDEAAVRAGVVNAARWVRECGFGNVLLEIANEYPHRGFAHDLIRNPKSQAELIRLARQTAPGLLISASGYGDGRIDPEVAEAVDFLLPLGVASEGNRHRKMGSADSRNQFSAQRTRTIARVRWHRRRIVQRNSA